MKRGASEDAMLAAAGALLLDPTYTVATGGCLRPVALHVLSHALEALAAQNSLTGASGGGGFIASGVPLAASEGGGGGGGGDEVFLAAVRHERACAALGLLLELLPHARPVAMVYLRASPPPFARLVATGGGGAATGGVDPSDTTTPTHLAATAGDAATGGNTREHALLVVRSCVRLLRVLGGDAAASSGATNTAGVSWDWTPLIRFLRHPDDEIRWTACMALERTLGLPGETAARLRAQQAATVGGSLRRST